jgi:hypothetical protein
LRKLRAILGVKGSLCLLSLAMVVLALVAYTATVTITPAKLFTVGATTDSWTVYVNDYNETRYLPSSASVPAGSSPPIGPPAIGDPSSFAFHVSTGTDKACAVNITMSTPANNNTFSSFQITVKSWTGLTWNDIAIYDAPTGGSAKSFIRGTNATNDFGYVQHPVSTSTFYVICVTYSYDLVDTIDVVTVTFQYTPLPQ